MFNHRGHTNCAGNAYELHANMLALGSQHLPLHDIGHQQFSRELCRLYTAVQTALYRWLLKGLHFTASHFLATPALLGVGPIQN